jgi:serine/threonine protein kinase
VRELSPPTAAAHGLTYRIAKLQSTLIDRQFARGKFYDLAGVDQKNQPKLRACLSRHAVVCESCIDSQRIARNRTVVPLGNDTAWWVLDYWIGGSPLDSLVYPWKELSHSLIKHLGTEILLGLDELHSHGIVMRELTPDKVIVSEDQQKCTLTDFEMAILTQGTVSVSGRWKNLRPYLAPENSDDSDYHRKPQIVYSRDIYSWAAIMIELLTGDPLADIKRLSECLPQAELAKYLRGCRHPRADLRPKAVAEVLEVWSKW